MAILQSFALLFAILATGDSQLLCGSSVAAPLVFPISNVTLQDQALRRGIAFSPGTPPQEFAFFLYPYVLTDVSLSKTLKLTAHRIFSGSNGTYIFDSDGICNSNISPLQCAGSRGALFDKGTSTTWSENSNQDTSVFPWEYIYSDSGDVFGSDTLQLNSSLSLKGFPLGVIRDSNEKSSDFSINAIGVGSNSTLLNKLMAAKVIASRTWSVFWGLTGADTSSQMDGNFVLGGYDAAKTTSTNFTGNIAADFKCRTKLVVTVTAITMNLANGSNPNILGSSYGSALQMCIDPSYPLITIPEDTWQHFANFDSNTSLNRSYGINGRGLTYPANNTYQGNLTFTLASGLNVTIPNHQLVIPDLYVNPTGTTIFNDSTRELMLNPLQAPNTNDFPLLGQTFLTSAYMMVNYDTNQFTLWQANATEKQSLVAVAPSLTCIPTGSPQTTVGQNATASASSGASAQATTNSSTGAPLPSGTKSISIGAVAGAACGGLALIVLSLLAWLYIHRARRRKAAQESRTFNLLGSEKLPASNMDDPHGYLNGSTIHQAPSEAAQEMGPAWPHEMGPGMPHELPGDGHGTPYELGSGLPSPPALPVRPRR